MCACMKAVDNLARKRRNEDDTEFSFFEQEITTNDSTLHWLAHEESGSRRER